MNRKENSSDEEKPLGIDPDDLSEDVLRAIVESFILREGTDYGAVEISLEKKIEQVLRQLHDGNIKIIFDQSTETVSLINLRDWEKFNRRS